MRKKRVIGKDKDAKNTHTGKFISATGKMFTMEDKGKEHSHTLSATAKVIGADGKASSLEDLKKGAMIRVTTMEGDPTIAVRVEVLKKGTGAKKETPERDR